MAGEKQVELRKNGSTKDITISSFSFARQLIRFKGTECLWTHRGTAGRRILMVQSDAQQIVDRLSARQLPLRKPVRPWDKALTDKIADLKLHPAIESGLHLLNDDIVSAHFLVRHAQNQAITDHWHGILHRLENDFRNSRLWYQNRITKETRDPYFESLEAAQKFVWDCQNVVVDKNSQGHDVQALEMKGMQEIRGLLKLAIDEFRLEPRADVSDYYGSSEADRDTKLKMTTNQVRREGHENE